MAQTAKNLLAVQETWVQFLGWEGPLEKRMAIHSSILTWDGGAWWATVHSILNTTERLLTHTQFPVPRIEPAYIGSIKIVFSD